MTERLSNELSAERKAQIEAGIGAIREAMAAIPSPHPVTLLAATKTVPASEINYATHHCGITDIGENRVQELLDKYDDLDLDGVRLHFIGQLQTNKVKYIIDKVDLIHSVDSERLALEIDRRARAIGKVMDVLIEINIGREESKGGILPEQAGKFADFLDTLPGIRARGIMTIAPVSEKKEDYLKFFAETYEIYLDNFVKKRHNNDGAILSMGMSGSFPQAIACGSNLIRIGSALFGDRAAKTKAPKT